MSEFNSVSIIVGAGIALFGTIITNYFNLKMTKLREEKSSERLIIELDKKNELKIRSFEHNVSMNNREFMPTITRSILIVVNQLFDCTEKLVLNYPGTTYTGTHPSFIFSNTIDKLITGFPNSIEEIVELSNSWYQAHKTFSNVIVENTIFLSNDILSDLNNFEIGCKNIRDYFYGRYSGIEDRQQFELEREEYNDQVRNFSFVEKDGITTPAHSVLKIYDELVESRNNLTTHINEYLKRKTDF